MSERKAEWWRPAVAQSPDRATEATGGLPEALGPPAVWGRETRAQQALGGIVMFAAWLTAVLLRMPRPPVPPSFAVTLTAPFVVTVGLGLGMLVAERLTRRRQARARGAFLWPLAGSTVGTVVMFPLGGMMAGFGLFGFGAAALVIREAILWARHARRPTSA
jgi:hypothetical protein